MTISHESGLQFKTLFLKTVLSPWCCSVAKLCPTLCDPRDCSPPGSSIHGVSQARILNGLLFPSPGDLPDPGIELVSPALQKISCITGRFFTPEPPGILCLISHLSKGCGSNTSS